VSINKKNNSDTGRSARVFSPLAAVLAAALAGCSSISIPLGDSVSKDGPALTGSLGPSVTVEQPLPAALAYSDAAVIGEVAGKSAFETVTNEQVDWVNGATGSVGTWKAGPQITSGDSNDCRAFGATVTSVSGVNRFSGVACRDERGNLTVKALSDSPADALDSPESETAAQG
jgi:hypothetical protein